MWTSPGLTLLSICNTSPLYLDIISIFDEDVCSTGVDGHPPRCCNSVARYPSGYTRVGARDQSCILAQPYRRLDNNRTNKEGLP
jgi:hypothetical protein